VAVNVAGLDDSLFSDTIFGHIKGAYTGAIKDRAGMIGKAANGTLFLDEIGDLSQESQVKLLRVLQEEEYSPLGSDKILKSRARLVFAVNTPLEVLVKEKKFRQDLYYRIRSHSILLPPLRKRKKDLPLLITSFLIEAADELNRPAPPIDGEIASLLKNYPFPGNIRELRGIISDLILRHEGQGSISEHLGKQLNLQVLNIYDEGPGGVFSALSSMPRLPSLKEASNGLIDEALKRSSGSITEAAKILGLTRSALSKRLTRRFEQDKDS